MITVVKIGGNVIDHPDQLKSFLKDFASIAGPKILVHGGGKLATRMAADLSVETRMIEGRRVTSPEMLEIAVMVYAGIINKRVVASLQAIGCDAIGLCGADMHCITSVRRPAIPVDYGEVGDVDTVNSSALKMLIDHGMTPVICAITADYDGNLLNTNADTIATSVAKAMSQEALTRLIFCFEKDGVLADVNDTNSVIRTITPESVDDLIAGGVISDGMIPKVTNAIKAITTSDLDSVIIKSSSRLHDDSGTCISK